MQDWETILHIVIKSRTTFRRVAQSRNPFPLVPPGKVTQIWTWPMVSDHLKNERSVIFFGWIAKKNSFCKWSLAPLFVHSLLLFPFCKLVRLPRDGPSGQASMFILLAFSSIPFSSMSQIKTVLNLLLQSEQNCFNLTVRERELDEKLHN